MYFLFFAFFLSSIYCAECLATQKSTAIVLPGNHQDGKTLDNQMISAESVKFWESQVSGITLGEFGDKDTNLLTTTLGYMYNQKLELNSGYVEQSLRNFSSDYQVDYEDFFLHFSEDTTIVEHDPSHGMHTALNRKPIIVGYTANELHAGFRLYQAPPWDADVFAYHAQNGGLYIYHSEAFDQLHFYFSQFGNNGNIKLEYLSPHSDSSNKKQWRSLPLKKDSTENFTKDGSIEWSPPLDWLPAATHDGSGLSYGHGQFFGSSLLKNKAKFFVVRISWEDLNFGIRPKLNNVLLKDSFPSISYKPKKGTSKTQKKSFRLIRGFDQQADLNSDNYLSEIEFMQRKNKNATARFRWESRVIPFGKMWGKHSSWALTNLSNPNLLLAFDSYYRKYWSSNGLKGSYNDDTKKLIGPNQFTIVSGGNISEWDLPITGSSAITRYENEFQSFLKSLSILHPKMMIGLNIGPANLYGKNGQHYLIDTGSLYLREHYIYPSIGMTGYSGISKMWDNLAFAEKSIKTIFQATVRYGKSTLFGSTKENWLQDLYSCLVIYYLTMPPSQSYFNQWNSSFQYGSGNTSKHNFWKEGIPKNIAYQPIHLWDIDIGEPLKYLKSNAIPLPLTLSTEMPKPNDYHIVGYSNQDFITLPNKKKIKISPSNTYFIYKNKTNKITKMPTDGVIARNFTKGKVLYRTDTFGKNKKFHQTEPIEIELNQEMKPVDTNGNVGKYTKKIKIGGYQGMILLY